MNPKQLGQRLAKLRNDAGLTQRALAERAGRTVVTISELERGLNSNPEIQTLLDIAGALHCRVVDFVPELLDVPAEEAAFAALRSKSEPEAVNG